MSGALLQLRDSLSLAFTKFKARKVRTLLTLITAAILAFILVVCSGVLSGFMRAANSTPQSALKDLHLAKVSLQADPQYPNIGVSSPVAPTEESIARVPDKPEYGEDKARKYIDSLAKTDKPSTIYFERSSAESSNASLDFLNPQPDPSDGFFYSPQLRWTSQAIVEPNLADGQSMQWKPGEPLPILISTDLVKQSHASELAKAETTSEKVKLLTRYRNELVGKTGNLKISSATLSPDTAEPDSKVLAPRSADEDKPVTLPVRVVGFVQGANFLNSDSPGYAIPYETTKDQPQLAELFKSATTAYPSFSTQQQRDNFLKANRASGGVEIFSDPVAQNRELFSPFLNAFRIATIVMLCLMAVPMATTISKLLSDSQRETGVFRAIGARNRHIVAIYGLYGLLVAIGAFLLALVAGIGVGLLITSAYGDKVELGFSTITDASVSVNFAQPALSQLLTILFGLIGGVVVGSAIPLLRALRRDPIKSLRDE